ncbi:hypothetical protein [Streptomyces sp. NRRL S-455]|uniref:hypothetical protein n=1 Tax=Streptomyces sp. NRRL S-455 TaxID=1463908 RepID=UPI0004C14EBD|nr:hypothetical protein [Streptomyces sp. NRRL S-455]
MDAFEAPGTVRGTALRFDPGHAGTLTMTTQFITAGTYNGVVLQPSWVLPLAAWFAGEAQPAAHGDLPGTLYGRRMDIAGDEYAIVWSTHTWAQLDCVLPFGTARVQAGPRGREYGSTVMLAPEARVDVAAWLRRTHAEGWTQREPAA